MFLAPRIRTCMALDCELQIAVGAPHQIECNSVAAGTGDS